MVKKQASPEKKPGKLRRFLARMKPEPATEQQKDEGAVMGLGLTLGLMILTAAIAGQGGCRCDLSKKKDSLAQSDSPVNVEKTVKDPQKEKPEQ